MGRPKKGTERYSDTPRMFQKDNGIWCVRWRDASKAKGYAEETLDTRDEQQAFANYLEYCKAWNEGTIPASPRFKAREPETKAQYTLSQCIKDWLREKTGMDLDDPERPRRNNSFSSSLGYLLQAFGNRPVASIAEEELAAYRDKRLAGQVGHKAVRPSTAYQEFSLLSTALNHAVRKRRLDWQQTPPIPYGEKGEPRLRWLRQDELLHLVRNSFWYRRAHRPGWHWADPETEPLPPLHRFIVLAYYTGGRRTALQELRWDNGQIDWHGGFIYLNPEGRRQTTKRRATVPITRFIRPWLERCYAEATTPYVLGGQDQWHPFKQVCRKIGFGPDVVPHTMRHTRITHLLQHGAQLDLVCQLVADSEATIKRTYLHECPFHVRDLLEGGRGYTLAEAEAHYCRQVFDAIGMQVPEEHLMPEVKRLPGA